MKRKTICAAANDDDFAESFDALPVERKERRANEEPAASSASKASGGGAKPKVEKEFAWMDSDDEGEEGAGGAEASSPGRRKANSDDGSDAGSDADVEVSEQALDAAHSFGRLSLMAPSLGRRLRAGQMSPEDVAAACRALCRTKFFDGELLEGLNRALKDLLKKDKLSPEQASDAVEALASLNAYDREVFSAVAVAFRPKVGLLDPNMRNLWLRAFKACGHEKEKDFLQMLEIPPLFPAVPGYRRLRCQHLSQGFCALGGGCSFSHEAGAPTTMDSDVQLSRAVPVVMTSCQNVVRQKEVASCAYGNQPRKTLGQMMAGFK